MSIESARQFAIAHVEKLALAICLLLLALSALFFMVLKDSPEGPRINLTRKITAVQQQTKEQTLADALTHAKTKKAPEDNWTQRTVYQACMNHEFDESGPGSSVGTTIERFVKAWEDANTGKVVTQPGPSAIHLGDGQWLVRRDLEPAGQKTIVHAFLYNPRLDALELLSKDANRLFDEFQAPALERFVDGIDASPDPWPGREYVPRLIAPKVVTVKLPSEILPVKDLELVQGRGVTEETEEDVKKYRIAKGRRIEISDIVWISGKATFDLSAQKVLNDRGLINQGSQFVRSGQAIITRVEVQRSVLLPLGEWSKWKTLQTSTTKKARQALPTAPADPTKVDAGEQYRRAAAQARAVIYQPPFFRLSGGELHQFQTKPGDIPEMAPLPEVTKRRDAARLLAPAARRDIDRERALERERAWEAEARALAARGEERSADIGSSGTANIWFHDLNVKPGGTYKYRMRVRILNPIYNHELAKGADKFLLELERKWDKAGKAQESKPITVPTLTEFFFVGSMGDQAMLEIHRWIHGRWVFKLGAITELGQPVVVPQRFKFPLPGGGETFKEKVILEPGIWPIDIIKKIRIRLADGSRETSKLVYADASGKLQQRIEYLDRKKALKERKRREKENTPLPSARPVKKANGGEVAPLPGGDGGNLPWDEGKTDEKPKKRRPRPRPPRRKIY